MGCINSTKKLTELKNENIFRAVRLHSDSPDLARTGFLELTPRELIFRTAANQRVVWALQHLRRYGLTGDVFSFEAGRRCMTGPGIYTFRCQQADQLYQLFQSYVNAVSLVTDEAFSFAERERNHPSHILGRLDANPHTNNYLEPAPIGTGGGTTAILQRTAFHESFSSSPLSLDSPDSVPSLSFTTNEVVHFQSEQYPSTPGVYVNTAAARCSGSGSNANSNLYLEHPLRKHIEHNNNMTNSKVIDAFDTLNCKGIVKRSSLDIPPDECAPMLASPSDAHMYANVEGISLGNGTCCSSRRERDREKFTDPTERCYENLNRMDLPLLLQPLSPPSSSTTFARETGSLGGSREQKQQQQPLPSAVNYIVLDLDQPRSPAQCSPKTHFGSGLSLVAEGSGSCGVGTATGGNSNGGACGIITDAHLPPTLTTGTTCGNLATTAMKTSKQESEEKVQEQQNEESSLGYSTIDFIKTCALIKSSTHGADFDPEPDNEESRITRHSKCVRKAYSISE